MCFTDEEFKDAIKTGEIIEIVYHGGSQPGTRRQIQPRKVKYERLTAYDVASQRIKHFNTEKISRPKLEPIFDATIANAPPPANFTEAIAPYMEIIDRTGLFVYQTDDCCRLYSRFKNGKMKKYPRKSGLSCEMEITMKLTCLFCLNYHGQAIVLLTSKFCSDISLTGQKRISGLFLRMEQDGKKFRI